MIVQEDSFFPIDFIMTQANATEQAEMIAKIDAGLKRSLFGLIMSPQPISIGMKIIHVIPRIDSFKIINANRVTKKGDNLVNMEAFANKRLSIE